MFLPFAEFGQIEDIGLDLQWSPDRLAAEVGRRASALAAAGIRPGGTIVLAHAGTARFFADLFATWTLGCTAACIDPALTQGEIENLLQFVAAAAVLVDAEPFEAKSGCPVLQLAQTAKAGEAPAVAAGSHDRPAIVLFTSGTTGAPKGVVLSFGAIFNRVALNRAAMGAAVRARTLVTLPTSFGHGLIGNALTPLLSGGDIVLHPTGLALASDLGRVIDRFRIGFMSSVPAFWRLALKMSDAPENSSLARVHVGSAPLSADLWTRIITWSRADVVNCYGITELANWIGGASARSGGIADGLVGMPWGGRAAVRDRTGAIRDRGEGEVLIRSPSRMTGYLHRPDLTEAAFEQDWYLTGDSGHIDAQGAIRLTGRIKEEINRAGLKVNPTEIDLLLATHPAVAQACAFAIPDEASGEIVGVAVRLSQDVGVQALRHWCAGKLRREAVPERWFVVNDMPQSERGKINREALRRMLAGGAQ